MSEHLPDVDQILPCPFCGGAVDPNGWMGTDSRGNRIQGPECEGCGATAQSLADWNKRRTAGYLLIEPAVRLLIEAAETRKLDTVTFGINVPGQGHFGLPQYYGVICESVDKLRASLTTGEGQ